ncbi:MAG: o-succinylbenzoate synthase [Thermonema sp.]|uniref:o-succinylbenzoate synthase n=1 Tax=Thermonema sp. TaxID=2231181 RepID=UPI0021DDE820|nr:o-succinylbenzoate synthase [Thermonema sp.]GIV40557.1 MAG: o-succinylbenzoate synthase [Thermonema sp.]
MRYQLIPYTLHFKFKAGTSRGYLTQKTSYFIVLTDEQGRRGIGEAAPVPKLSPDDTPALPAQAHALLKALCRTSFDSLSAALEWLAQHCPPNFPSLRFGVETALRSLWSKHPFILFDMPFVHGQQGIPINGLVWMGDLDFMQKQIEEKLQQGFRCIKMKIGALEVEKELGLLRELRQRFPADALTLRVDANGAFGAEEVMPVLEALAALEVHSIEQPIRPGQWDAMAHLCEVSPVAIALDEELIGIHTKEEKTRLLKHIRPPYIILKPGLVGGLQAADEWIQAAKLTGTGWWATSALEANVGLNAISQWTATFAPALPQGLGTGQLYHNNVPLPLSIANGHLYAHFERHASIDFDAWFNKA